MKDNEEIEQLRAKSHETYNDVGGYATAAAIGAVGTSLLVGVYSGQYLFDGIAAGVAAVAIALMAFAAIDVFVLAITGALGVGGYD